MEGRCELDGGSVVGLIGERTRGARGGAAVTWSPGTRSSIVPRASAPPSRIPVAETSSFSMLAPPPLTSPPATAATPRSSRALRARTRTPMRRRESPRRRPRTEHVLSVIAFCDTSMRSRGTSRVARDRKSAVASVSESCGGEKSENSLAGGENDCREVLQ